MRSALVVSGGGPAGYVGAHRAAQLGQKVACVEKERAGGTCLNWGCIPTKSLLRNAELYQLLQKRAADFGFSFENLSFDWAKIISRSRGVADKLAGGVEFLFKKNKIDYLRGEAAIAEPGKVTYRTQDNKEEAIESSHILIATGAVSRELPGLSTNGKTVLNSHDAMILEKQPARLTVLGAGAIGVEFGYFFNAFGTEVTIVEMMPNELPVEDTEISLAVEKSLTSQGIKIFTNTRVIKAEATDIGVGGTIEGKKQETLEGDCVLVAVGVAAFLPKGIELKLDKKGNIAVNDRYETSLSGEYAAGDVIGPPWLAIVASWEAIQTATGIFTKHKPKRL